MLWYTLLAFHISELIRGTFFTCSCSSYSDDGLSCLENNHCSQEAANHYSKRIPRPPSGLKYTA